jgi:2-dehydro-3-deoxygalactonokinase
VTLAVDAGEARFVAVDWGTTRVRASLVGRDGVVLDRMQSDLGVQSVPAGGFPEALGAACAPWFEAHSDLPVLMAGMVGSRNGWVEAPYLHCPCGPREAARSLTAIPGLGREVLLVPGVDIRGIDGDYDVMRGEETQAFGAGEDDGLLCLPGTHSKWVEMRDGRIARFVTFITGELYAALSSSFVARLAEGPDDAAAGALEAARALRGGGGLTRALFQARTRVLGGEMAPQAVRPLLSHLLVEAELDGATALFGNIGRLRLVAGEPQLGLYRSALGARGCAVEAIDPATAMLAGLDRIMAARDGT